jgi:protocatechuate 3,4-dioxygenase beta subunit
VAGVVRIASTGDPVRKVTVRLEPADGRGGPDRGSTTTTDAAGRFTLAGIEPGRYRLNAQKAGFVRQSYGGKPGSWTGTTLTLTKSQRVSDLELKMIPHAVVTGRVTDEDGDPVTSAQVQLGRFAYMEGRRQLMPMGVAQTNDLGEFRIFGVPPGRYLLSSAPPGYSMFGSVDRSAGAVPQETEAPTFFPASVDAASATVINVALGQQLQGMDIRLQRRAAYRVRGRVSGAPSGRASGNIMLWPRNTVSYTYRPAGSARWDQRTGQFEFQRVFPGSYTLVAEVFGDGRRMRATARIEVTSGDVDNLTVAVQPPLEVQGSVEIEGNVAAENLSVSLQPWELSGGFPGGYAPGEVKQDQTFKIANVAPERYRVGVFPIPQGCYLKTARMGEVDVLKDGLDLSQGGAGTGLKLVISASAAQVDGAVTNEKGEAAAGASVLLVPQREDLNQPTLFKSTTTDQNGTYQFQGVAPGDYLLFAVEATEPGEERDPEFRKQHESSAEKLTLRENGRESKALRIKK